MRLYHTLPLLFVSGACDAPSDVTHDATSDVAFDAAHEDALDAVREDALDAAYPDVVDATLPDLSLPPLPDGGVACGECTRGYIHLSGSVTLRPNALDEVSGVVESRRTPGIFFVHNDSGDAARFFAIGSDGRKVGEYRLRDALAIDWEDIALGPCPAGDCVYLGDIGNNGGGRRELTIYRVSEPSPTGGAEVDVAWEALPFRYADGSYNAETLLIHPRTGDLYVVTKMIEGASGVYVLRAPHTPGSARIAARVATLTPPAPGRQLVTGGDLHPCADRLLLRTYTGVYEYVRPTEAPFDAIFTATPRAVASVTERQGEAVAWRVDGHGYVTVSEGAHPPIHVFGCAVP